MTTVHLVRVCQSYLGTFGVLVKDLIPLCATLERPWADNASEVSCIPAGTYPCRKYSSEKYDDVWEITGVPQRSKILFHAGNTINDTKGCVLVGRGYAFDGTIFSSQDALKYLRGTLPDVFTLVVTE